MTEPVAFEPAKLRKLLAHALRCARAGDLLGLAASPLAAMPLLADWYATAAPHDSAARGQALLALLEGLIERLRPAGTRHWTRLSWRPYNVLSGFYIEGRRISELAELMGVVEQTIYPVRTQALATLASLLIEEQERAPADRPNRAIPGVYAALPPAQQTLLRLLALDGPPLPLGLIHRLALATNVSAPEYDLHALSQADLIIVNSERTSYGGLLKLQPFLRTLLRPAEQQSWYAVLGATALEADQFLDAARYLWLAGAYHRAATLLIEQHQALIDAYQTVELQALLHQFTAAQLADEPLWMRLKLLLGDVALTMNDVTAALHEYQQALAATAPLLKAEAYYRRGKAFRSQSTDEAASHFSYSISLLQEHAPAADLLYQVYLDQAWMQFQDLQNWAAAEASLHAAEALIRPADRAAWAQWANAWGQFRSHQGQFVAAISFHRDAWLAANEVQDALLMTHMAHNLGNDYMALGQYDLALVYLRQSAALAQETGNRRMQGLCQKSLGACCFYLQQYRQALTHYHQAHAIFAAMHNRNWQANTSYDIAEASAELGEQEQMRQFYAEAITLARQGNLGRLLRDLAGLARRYPGLYPPTTLLNERQQRVYDYLKCNPSITNRDYRDLTNVSPKQASRDLNELVDQQVLARVGAGRATRYRLPEG